MKKAIFTLLTSVAVLVAFAQAPYAGNSGPSVCSPSGTLDEPGLAPNYDSLPCAIPGQLYDYTIQFKNFDTITFGGNTLTVQKLQIVSLSNLPNGICWATNKADNSWGNQEDGCIYVTGITNDALGTYKLQITVNAWVGPAAPGTLIPNINAEAANLRYYVGVAATPCGVPNNIDTAAATLKTASAPAVCTTVGIEDAKSNVRSISITPNPMTNNAEVKFYSEIKGSVTERIQDISGREISSRIIEVKAGNNTNIIERGTIPAGVYFYTITDGQYTSSHRFVISQ